MGKEILCNKHYCESCEHILKEKGEQISGCVFDCLSTISDEEINLVCGNCGGEIGKCSQIRELKKTQATLVESALKNPKITVVCFTAPSVRASITEVFDNGNVNDGQGKLVTALKLLGFDVVFDMNVAADFTVVEEAKEFEKRLRENKNLPMMTSCCPGWVNYVTKFYKEFIPNLSTCKSPQQMFGSLINTYYAEKVNKKSTELFVVSIVPCLAKKLEAKQSGMNSNIGYDVDAAITTTEIIDMIKKAGIDFNSLKESNFDSFFGTASGAGTIFGNTGGVMEAVLRTVGDSIADSDVSETMYELVRGQEGVRKKEISIGDKVIKIAVISGIVNAKQVLEDIKAGKEQFDFIEVMACPGGCVGGGGQPRCINGDQQLITRERSKILYESELKLNNKKAHNNPAVKDVYQKFIGEVGGKKAHKLLHRRYD